MNNLPSDIYIEICKQATTDQLLALRLISRHFVPPPNSQFWQRRIYHDYGIRPNNIEKYNIQNKTHFANWRELWLFYTKIVQWARDDPSDCVTDWAGRRIIRHYIMKYSLADDNCISADPYEEVDDCSIDKDDQNILRELMGPIVDEIRSRSNYLMTILLNTGHLTAAMVSKRVRTLKALEHVVGYVLLSMYRKSGNTYRLRRMLNLVCPNKRYLQSSISDYCERGYTKAAKICMEFMPYAHTNTLNENLSRVIDEKFSSSIMGSCMKLALPLFNMIGDGQ